MFVEHVWSLVLAEMVHALENCQINIPHSTDYAIDNNLENIYVCKPIDL